MLHTVFCTKGSTPAASISSSVAKAEDELELVETCACVSSSQPEKTRLFLFFDSAPVVKEEPYGIVAHMAWVRKITVL